MKHAPGLVSPKNLGENGFHRLRARHVGQAEVTAAGAEGELLRIEAQRVQDSRVELMHVNLVLNGRAAEFVGRAVEGATLDPAAREP